jgi:hypothetical protein
MTGYNGWKNRATWNVALWIGNDESLYRTAAAYVARASRVSWRGFVEYAGLAGERTPDGFKYDGKALDARALSAMLRDFK